MPASSDRGLPIGSVYLANYLLKNKNHKVQNMFLEIIILIEKY